MANPFLDFLESMTIAMEADDITSQTANEVRSAIGDNPSIQINDNNREEEEDLNKVNDIFGTAAPEEDGPSGDPEQDKKEGAEDIGTLDEENLDNNANSITGEEDPNVSGDDSQFQDEEDSGDSSPNEDLLFTKKNRIRDNLVQLYTIISGDIEIIVNSLTNINDMKTVQVMNAVINHLRNCKNYIYKTLTQNLASLEYDELLQRYITLKRVYDICIEMMETHFEKEKK